MSEMQKEVTRARDFARDLERAWGDALVSVVLYGSAARGEYRPGASDLNLLVLLRDIAPATLQRGAALARAWEAAKNPPPLVMGADEFRASADVFPMELADIRDAHVLLHGADPFDGVEISAADLRAQLERELKGAALRLRTRYLTQAGDAAAFQPVLLKSLSSFLVMFRTVLRLSGGDGAHDPEAVIRATAQRVGFDPAPLLQIAAARAGRGSVDVRPNSPAVTGYLDAVERVVEYVDRFEAAAG